MTVRKEMNFEIKKIKRKLQIIKIRKTFLKCKRNEVKHQETEKCRCPPKARIITNL